MQNPRAVAFDFEGELVDEPALADTRFAADQHEAARALRRAIPIGAQLLELAFAIDERKRPASESLDA